MSIETQGAPATLLTPEATTDEIADQIMAKMEAPANPETEPDEPLKPAVEDTAPNGEQQAEDNQEPASTDETPQPKHKVKVRGEELEVTLDELRNGYSRTEDYKAKTAEVAEQRRTVEAERAKIGEWQQQQLAAINKTLAMAQNFDPILAEGQKTDWNQLAQTDPTAYVQKRAAFESRLNEVQGLQAQQMQIQEQRQRAFLSEQHRILSEKLPEWQSEEGRAKINKIAASYLQQVGFTTEEIKQVADHRLLMTILDAAKYREMQAAQKSVVEKKTAAEPPKTAKPAASNDAKNKDGRVVALKKQALRSGRDDDIAAAVMAALGNQ